MVLLAPPPDNYEGEIDFQSKAWADARHQFLEGRRAQKKHADTEEKLQDFLQQSCSEKDIRKYIGDTQKEKPQYAAGLGVIMTKIDAFMKVGDLAIKSAPESVGLAWAGIRLCLHSVQDDFATFSQYNDACSYMIGILINCSVYGDMFGRPHAAKKMEEIHKQVLKRIPKIYADILEFNYSMHKYTNKNRGLRILTGTYKSAAAKYKDKFDGLKNNEAEMRKFAAVASQQLAQYYAELNMQNEAEILRKQNQVLLSLTEIDAEIRNANRIMEEGLKFVTSELRDLKKQSPFEKARRTFEDNLKVLNQYMDRQTAALQETRNREPGTCQWIFNEAEYKSWYSSIANSMLWITAEGGFGKSFLMGSVIEKLQRQLEETLINVSFFFCKRGDPSTEKIEIIKNSLISQLYQDVEDNSNILDEANRLVSSLIPKKGIKSATTEAKSEAKKNPTFVEIYLGLVRLLDREVFLVIDALDEIEDRGYQSFLKDLGAVKNESTGTKVHILLGSRPEGGLKRELTDVPTFDVKGHNTEDIRLNVTTLVGKLSGFSASERQMAIDDVVTKSGGQFRYVKPAMDFLRLPWSRPLETRLKKLQEGLTNSYTQALQLTDPNYHGLLKTCLTWVLLGEGQVHVTEVMDAFQGTYSEGQDDTDIGDMEHDEEPLKQVEKAGKTFLDVNWTTRVISPRHQTVTEYFLNDLIEDAVIIEDDAHICSICRETRLKQNRPFAINRKEGHLDMALSILQTLCSPVFWRKNYPETYWEKFFPEYIEELERAKEIDVKVAGEEKPEGKADEGADTQNDVIKEKLEGDENESESLEKTEPGLRVSSTEEASAPKDSSKTTEITEPPPITVTKSEDTEQLAVQTNENGVDEDAEEAVDNVSEIDSDINPEDIDYDYDYQLPSSGVIRYEVSHCTYHLKKVEELWKLEERRGPRFDRLRTLMKNFFRADSEYFKKWSQIQTRLSSSIFVYSIGAEIHPLLVAAGYGLTDLLELLIESGAKDVAVLNKALYYAAREATNHTAAFEILFNAGADPKDMTYGISALMTLLYQNVNVDVLQLFLKRGADAKQTTGWLWTPLNYLVLTASDEQVGLLNILKEHGADLNSRDDEGETPLHNLVRRRDCPLGFLKRYIELGGDVNADDKEEQRPLYEVCFSGNDEAAETILAFKPEIERADKLGVTALLAAASNGHTSTCELLLKHAANIKALDNRNQSCFLLACQSNNPKTALFISSQLDEKNEYLFSLKSSSGKSPLAKAASKGHTEVVKFLLEKIDPTSVNEQDTKRGHTPLHVAGMNGSKDIVELLLDHGASSTITNKRGNTPFRECCRVWTQNQSKDAGALLLLLEREPPESFQNDELLYAAASKGNIDVLEKLVQNGVSVHQMDRHGWTPLQIANQYGHAEAADFLAKKGAVIGRKPTSWSCDIKWVKISNDGKEVEWLSEGHKLPGQDSRAGVMSNHPIPAGTSRYYFEITVIEPGGKCTYPIVGLGLCNAVAKNSGWMPGWRNATSGGAPSWAYHGDDGCLFTDRKSSKKDAGLFLPQYGHDDTIGCAVDFEKGEVFFTKNGKRLKDAFKDVKGRLHPVVGLGQEVIVRGNWGLDLKNFPFKWGNANVVGGGWKD